MKRTERESVKMRRVLYCLLFLIVSTSIILQIPPTMNSQHKALAATGEVLLCSNSSAGTLGNSVSDAPMMSSDGRYLVFSSLADNLATGDTNGKRDIYRKDLSTGEATRCSTSTSGGEPNQDCNNPSISADGRYIAFESVAWNLVSDDTNNTYDVFCKDLVTGNLIRCSTDSSGTQGDQESTNPCMSSDGKFIAFESAATNLVAGDTNNCRDIFRKNLATGETLRCSADASGIQDNNTCYRPRLSQDGRYVVFESAASNLVSTDTNGEWDIFRKDMVSGEIVICSTDSSGTQADGSSKYAAMSTDGKYVSFRSDAANLVAGDYNANFDIFLKDLSNGQTVCCSTNPAGSFVNGIGERSAVSDDGRFVVFEARSYFLVGSSGPGSTSIYLKDLSTGRVLHCANSSIIGGQYGGLNPSISSDGRYVAFESRTPLVAGDNNDLTDIFRKEPLVESPYVTSSNPPSGLPGTELTLKGFDFGAIQGGSYVEFGYYKVHASIYNEWSDTQVKVVVPDGVSGKVDFRLVTTLGNSNTAYFSVTPPHIDSINPTADFVGSEVTIKGSLFGATQGSGSVSFGGKHLTEGLVWSDTEIKVHVPYLDGNTGKVDVGVTSVFGTSNTVTFEVVPYAVSFAEGYTGPGFQEYLCLGNPQALNVSAQVIFLFPDGTGFRQDLTVPAGSRCTLDVNQIVGPDMEVSTVVFSDLEIVAERPMYFSYGEGWTGGHDVIGTPWISEGWCFAEGYTGPGFDEWICVLNASSSTANLTFHFQTQEAGEIDVTGSVPPLSRSSFKVNDLLGPDYQCSLFLESDQYVVAERSCYFDYSGTGGYSWEGGHCVMGTPYIAQQYYFAEGTTRGNFEEWITLQNPGSSPLEVTALYQLGEGQGSPVTRKYSIPAENRFTIFVPDEVGKEKDVSVKLSSDSYFLAERPMYFDYGVGWKGGHCVIGAMGTSDDWFFAEGYTSSGFDEWLCLQNAGNENAKVEIRYLTQESGALATREITIPANKRTTIRVNDDAGPDYQLSVSLRVISGPSIVAERPMYFNFNGVWDGGHDVVGYMPTYYSSSSLAFEKSGMPDMVRLSEAYDAFNLK
jgi:Tol biopolymer transport system component